jgi:hypothetical protein
MLLFKKQSHKGKDFMRQIRLKGVDCLYLTQNGENCWLCSNSDEILVSVR